MENWNEVETYSYSEFYSKIRLSYTQVKNSLILSLLPLQQMTLQPKEDVVEMTREEIVDLLLKKLQRKELVELLHMLQLIRERNSDVCSYIKYILLGILLK